MRNYTIFPSLVGRVTDNPTLSGSLVLDLDARFGVTLVGSDVSAWADGAGAANNFSEATDRPVYTAADSTWGGRPSIAYTAANNDHLISADAASTWKFIHDGTGMALAFICRPTDGAANLILAATHDGNSANVGFNAHYSPTNSNFQLLVVNGAAAAGCAPTTGTAPIGGRYSVLFTYSDAATPKRAVYVNGALAGSTSGAFAPSASDPAGTMRIGQLTNVLNDFEGTIPVSHAWTRYFTPADAALYHQWAVANYGL